VVIIRRRFGSQTRRQKIAVCLQTRQSQPIGTTLALSSPRRLFLVVDPQMEVEVSIGHAVCNRRCNERGDVCRQRSGPLSSCLRRPRGGVFLQPVSPRISPCARVQRESARARRAILLNSNDRAGI